MHPFTSLTLWALAACTTLLLPAQTVLPVYSAAAFLCLLALKSTRRRAKYVAWLMLSLGFGLWLVHGGWLTEWISGQPRDPQRWIYAVTLLATPAGDRVDVAAMDAVCAGSAVYSRPVRFTSATRHRLPVRWPAAGRRTAQTTTDDCS